MKLSADVAGSSKVVERLRAITPAIRSAVYQRVVRLTIQLQRHVVQDKLQGQVLNVKTGRLQRSIQQAVTDSGSDVTGIVSTALKYAAAHEYGFDGTVNVKAHLRTIKTAFGKSLKAPVTVQVSAHTMAMKMPERSFLRSALLDMQDEIVEGIRQAAGEGVNR